MEFCKRLSAKEGRAYSLPTEAQWEYACRAGSTSRFSKDATGADVTISNLANYAWYDENAGGKTHPVGKKRPNAFGLYDMHGNVNEWCADWYGKYDKTIQLLNPAGPINGKKRVVRGGCWHSDAMNCRSADRVEHRPNWDKRRNPDDSEAEEKNGYRGFRVSQTQGNTAPLMLCYASLSFLLFILLLLFFLFLMSKKRMHCNVSNQPL